MTPDKQSDYHLSMLSEWVGLGGYFDPTKPLVQAGLTETTMWVPAYPGAEYLKKQTSYAPWAEVYANNHGDGSFKDWMYFNISAGDTVYASAWQTASSDTDQFFVEDVTTGDYDTDLGHGYRSDGSSAEWIVETPGFHQFPFLDYGQVSVRDAQASYTTPAGQHSYAQFQLLPRTRLNMKRGSTDMSDCVMWDRSNDQVSCYWIHS